MRTYCLFLLVCTCSFAAAVVHSNMKLRGAYPPPRPPQMHAQFASKKWQQSMKRPPVRSRPIPVHMPPQHKIPMGIRPTINNRPVAVPNRQFWTNTKTFVMPFEKQFEKPFEQPYGLSVSTSPQKTFISSPPIKQQDYDFHIQTNSIPVQVNTVKQVGEKGPIHTIPAPNLSLRDKPVFVDEVKNYPGSASFADLRNKPVFVDEVKNYPGSASFADLRNKPVFVDEVKNYPGSASFAQIQNYHQYQVTESSEQIPNYKQYQNQQNNYELVQNSELKTHMHQSPEVLLKYQQQLSQDLSNENIGTKLYETFPQQGSSLENYAVSELRRPQVQQNYNIQNIPDLATLLAQQPGKDFIHHQSQQSQIGPDQKSEQTQYQTFNYEEQGQNNKDLSATYNLGPADEAHPTISRKMFDSLAQSEYVQNYFDTRQRDNSNNNDNVEPDAKPSQEAVIIEEDDSGSHSNSSDFSLPNKEAAETLASLQAAGKINSNLMEMTKKAQNKAPMSIYVPDSEYEDSEKTNTKSTIDDSTHDQEYDDYEQEDFPEEQDHHNDEFGQKIRQ